jgi:hypothetical protein
MAEIFTASEIAAISGGAIVGDPRARMSLAVADSREASPEKPSREAPPASSPAPTGGIG